MKNSIDSKRSEQLQETFVNDNGIIGKRIPLSKLRRFRRYYLHKKVKEITNVDPRTKAIEQSKHDDNKYVKELIKEYGYGIQTRLL